jgi:(2Fe-2S) ferredoxin
MAAPLFCVCTHGAHDQCCATRGRPVAAAMADRFPDETWEVSHIGGDRFAANLLVLPSGLYYGRLDAVSALSVAGSHLAGQLDLDHLRGRSGWAMPVQVAEISLRRDLAETRDDALRLVTRSVADGVTEAVFDVAGARYAVRVRSAPGAQRHRLTCRASRTSPAPEHTLLGVTRVP